jgi:YVTN family beta-propeller protein
LEGDSLKSFILDGLTLFATAALDSGVVGSSRKGRFLSAKQRWRLLTHAGDAETNRVLASPRPIVVITLFLVAVLPRVWGQAESVSLPRQTATEIALAGAQSYTQEGVTVKFSIEPVHAAKGKPLVLLAGTEARIRFSIADANDGKPISNLHPTAWVDYREEAQAPDAKQCREKIQSFLQSDFSQRPTLDLNTYFILALNRDPSISVIDPLSGFAGSKLYTLVSLPDPGEDWAISADKKRLYVSMPLAGQTAVIDTVTWKVIANVSSGVNPTRIALQPDGRYLWVGNDAPDKPHSAVTVIDTITLRVVAQFKMGAGHHEIGFNGDDSLAFVTNKQNGTVSVIDIRKLARLTTIEVGLLPAALAYSPLSKTVYVVNEGDGSIIAIDGARLKIVARMKVQPGLCAIRFRPSDRFGFVVNRATDSVYIFDVSTNRVVHVVPVGLGADQVTFTRGFAYIHSAGTASVTMIKLSDLGKDNEAAVTRFPAGERAPGDPAANLWPDAIVPAPEDGAVLVANPADKTIYFYTEGMAAPMGTFENYRRDPKALLVLDMSLRESAPGVYVTTVRLPGPGHYDMAFLLDSPRLVNCFDAAVAENPDQPQSTAVHIAIEPLLNEVPARVGENYHLRFKIRQADSKQTESALKDMGVLIFLAPGIWQQRELARPVEDGAYEVNFEPPQAGTYYVYFQCPSLNVRFSQITPLVLQAVKR